MSSLESSQSDAKTPNDPTTQLAAVNAAIGNAAMNPGGMTVGADMAVDGAILAMAGPVVAGVGAFIDAMGGGTNNSGNQNNPQQSSQYIPAGFGGPSTGQKQAPKISPLMSRDSMSYSEKKQADALANKAKTQKPAAGAGRSVFVASVADKSNKNSGPGLGERLGITGASMAVPPLGATITDGMAAKLGIDPKLIKERQYAMKIKENPYGITGQASTQRLKQDLKNNNAPTAQKTVQNFPKHGMS
jgi:hypothetical protein